MRFKKPEKLAEDMLVCCDAPMNENITQIIPYYFQGYLRASNIGELRNNHDPSCTYEGDNNVLGQQASNWLVRQWENGVEDQSGTAEFINRHEAILEYTFTEIVKKYPANSIDCKCWNSNFAYRTSLS